MQKSYILTTEFRFVLAATDHLHRKLAKFEARMHSLEDALTIAQTTYNLEPHPLLSDREDIYTDTQELKPMPEASEDEADLTPYISGSLHVNGSGLSRFFGPSGAPESLLLVRNDIVLCFHTLILAPLGHFNPGRTIEVYLDSTPAGIGQLLPST
ncbi:hypothetical protein HHX47_DHR2000534 [Lentinula edodes]|nr:hypothetical protein HHX47_DHR2000534 [Lentinula edodes]